MTTRSYSVLDTAIGDTILPLFYSTSAPVNGTSGTLANVAIAGALLIYNGQLYQNTNTLASPTWSVGPSGAAVAITGGTIDGTPIGGSTPAAVAATTLSSSGLATVASAKVDTGTKTATATAGAATLNKSSGIITSESLTTAAGATYTLTLTNSTIAAADQVFASVQLGGATTGTPAVATVTPAAGSVVIVIQNIASAAALNGTIKIAYTVQKA